MYVVHFDPSSMSCSSLVDGTVTGKISTLSGKGFSAAEILNLFNLSVLI